MHIELLACIADGRWLRRSGLTVSGVTAGDQAADMCRGLATVGSDPLVRNRVSSGLIRSSMLDNWLEAEAVAGSDPSSTAMGCATEDQ